MPKNIRPAPGALDVPFSGLSKVPGPAHEVQGLKRSRSGPNLDNAPQGQLKPRAFARLSNLAKQAPRTTRVTRNWCQVRQPVFIQKAERPVNSRVSCRVLATSKPPKKDSFWSSHQENGRGSTSRRWGLSPVCSAASSVAKSVLWGRPTHSSVSARVPLFHMSLQVASAEALRVCAPRDPAGTLGDRPRARVAVGWPLLVKEEVGGHFSACWGGERSAVCHS